MARIFRQTYTKPLPAEAEIFTRRGKKYAHFKDGRGKTVKAPLSEDGNNVIRETDKWYIEYKDADGTIKKVAGFRDRQATEQYASKLERDAEHVRSGYKPKEHKQLNRPLKEHLEEFKQYLQNKGTSEKQAQQVYNRAFRILEGCGFAQWSDIRASKVQSFLAGLRADKESKRGISAQTSNGYLQAIKSFCKWLQGERRAPENPLEPLQGLNVKTDRRHDRRALTERECQTLLQVTATQDARFGMTGVERALLYQTALESGLRATEIQTLTISSCSLDVVPPTLTVKAAYSKHRREDVQPIPHALTDSLKDYIEGRPVEELLFPTMPKVDKLAKMLRADLEDAEIPYEDDAGRVVDFHALRHTYITNLARSGVHPKIAMDLARHSDINLTLARYSHTLVADRSKALGALPKLTEDTNEPAIQKATGTYDVKPETPILEAETTSRATSGETSSLNCIPNKELAEPAKRLENRCTERYRGFESLLLR